MHNEISEPEDDGLAPIPALLLDNQLCFLVYRLQRGIADLYRPILLEFGLTYPQYLVMLALWETSPMTVGQLGERLQLDSGTLSPLLKRLELAGRLERRRRPTDERSVEIALTPEGRALRDQVVDVPRRVGSCLAASADQAAGLRTELTALLERLQAVP